MGVCTVSGGLTESVECAICDWLYVAVLAEVDIPHRVYYVIVLRHVFTNITLDLVPRLCMLVRGRIEDRS